MQRIPATRLFAGFIASLGWLALGLQLWLTVSLVLAQGRGLGMGLVIYFGFFTVLTNLLAAAVLSAISAGPGCPGHTLARHPVTLTTTAAAISIVGLVYFFSLRHLWQPEGAQFVADAALHYVAPVLVVLFWLAVMPVRPLAWRHLPWLMVYPLVYLVYVFARGEWVGLYPYDFVNVLTIGYRAAMLNTLGLLAAYAAMVGLLLGLKALTGQPTAARFF